jgi:hypothetical protein
MKLLNRIRSAKLARDPLEPVIKPFTPAKPMVFSAPMRSVMDDDRIPYVIRQAFTDPPPPRPESRRSRG